jgi:hypothetical protein
VWNKVSAACSTFLHSMKFIFCSHIYKFTRWNIICQVKVNIVGGT